MHLTHSDVTVPDLFLIDALQRDVLNALFLLEEMHNFVIMVNNQAVSNVPGFIRVYVGDLNLTESQRQMFVGFVFNPSDGTYEVIDGIFADDLNHFYFDFNGPGVIGAMFYNVGVVPATEPLLRFTIGQYRYYHNGMPLMSDAAPFISLDRAMVPLRIISEALDGVPFWDDANRVAYIFKGDVVLRLPMGVALPDGMGLPEIRNDRVFVPARFVIEYFDAVTFWDPVNREVTVFLQQ